MVGLTINMYIFTAFQATTDNVQVETGIPIRDRSSPDGFKEISNNKTL